MKIVHFIDIIKEYHASCYAGFCLKIKWNVSAITGYKNANGYIVQRVHYIDTVEAAPPVDDYYEAWAVHDGICDGSSAYGYDDAFQLDINFSNRPICKSLGKQGCVCYETSVYWVDRKHHLYETIDSWKEGGAPMALDLKSVPVNDCPIFEDIKPNFARTFKHEFDCRSRENVEMALRQAYGSRIEQKDPSLRGTLQSILVGSDYEQLIEILCSPA